MKEKRERTCNNLTRVYICTQQLNDTTWHKDCASSCLSLYSLACDAVEGPGLVLDVGIEISPELDEEEGRCGALVVQLLQAALLLREFVVYLPDVDRLEERIRVVRRASYVDEQVPLVLCARKIGELSVENFSLSLIFCFTIKMTDHDFTMKLINQTIFLVLKISWNSTDLLVNETTESLFLVY